MKGVQKRAKIYVKTVHDGMKLECDSRQKRFANNQSLAVLKKSVHDKIKINCDLCNKTFSTNAHIWRHKKSVHEKIRINCDLCDKSFTQSNWLKIHKINVHKYIKVKPTVIENLVQDEVNQAVDGQNESIHNELNQNFVEDKTDQETAHEILKPDKSDQNEMDLKTEVKFKRAKDEIVQDKTDQDKNDDISPNKPKTALKFLKNIKAKFLDHPRIYQYFLILLKNLKEQPTSQDLRNKAVILIQNYPELTREFNRYFPIKCQSRVLKIKTEVETPNDNQNNKKDLKTEVKTDQDENISRQFSCDMCENIFGQMSLLESHIVDAHLNKKISSTSNTCEENSNKEPKCVAEFAQFENVGKIVAGPKMEDQFENMGVISMMIPATSSIGSNLFPNRVSRDEKKARELNLPFAVSEIVDLPINGFNELLSRYTLNESQLMLCRDIRRHGKNKVSAQNCRKRKMDRISHLKEEVSITRHKKQILLTEREELYRLRTEWTNKLMNLEASVLLGLNRNPETYSLDYSGPSVKVTIRLANSKV